MKQEIISVLLNTMYHKLSREDLERLFPRVKGEVLDLTQQGWIVHGFDGEIYLNMNTVKNLILPMVK